MKINKVLVLITLLVCSVFVGIESLSGGVSISVSPPLLELSVPAGGLRLFELAVVNSGDKPVKIRYYTMDMSLEPDGSVTLLKAGTSSRSLAQWITLDKNEFDLEPGKMELIKGKVTVPRGNRGGRYAVIVFETSPPDVREAKGRGKILLGARLGTILMLSIPHTLKQKGRIGTIEWEARGDSKPHPILFTLSFKNTGNVHLRIRGSIVIKNKEGRIIDRIPLEAGTGTVLPDGIRVLEGTWSNRRKMKEGDYAAEARINFKGGQVRTQVPFSIK